jgi:hypothetical protein
MSPDNSNFYSFNLFLVTSYSHRDISAHIADVAASSIPALAAHIPQREASIQLFALPGQPNVFEVRMPLQAVAYSDPSDLSLGFTLSW